jgi:hypothetical protein
LLDCNDGKDHSIGSRERVGACQQEMAEGTKLVLVLSFSSSNSKSEKAGRIA